MKVDLGQNVRLVVSLWRFVVLSCHFVVSLCRFGTQMLLVDLLFSEVDSANCQFDSSAGLVCRFVIAFRRFDSSTKRGYNSTYIT